MSGCGQLLISHMTHYEYTKATNQIAAINVRSMYKAIICGCGQLVGYIK